MEVELLPCPFCGGGAEVYPEESNSGYYVACFQPQWPVEFCYAALGEEYDRDAMPEHRFRTKEEAIKAWNTRNTRAYQKRLFDECVSANWDAAQRNTFAEEIAHLHEELSEAFREWRRHKNFDVRHGENGKPEGIPIELADVLIGLFYNAELHGFDLFEAVEQKHKFNLTRNYTAEGRQLHSPTTTALD